MLQARRVEAADIDPPRRNGFPSSAIEVAYVVYKFLLRPTLIAMSVESNPKNK